VNLDLPGISIHAVDVASGTVAAGMQVDLFAVSPADERRLIVRGRLSARGTLDDPALDATFAAGIYEAVFQVGGYLRSIGSSLPSLPFLDIVTYRFGIAEPQQHYHLPFKFTAWGYSCFRGGA
jgi:5-hydroxyisourate hydrolase